MQPSRRHCIYASLAALAILIATPRTFAGSLTITSSPAGATVEIDGAISGTTPYHVEYPGGYFHKPHTVFGSKLEHALILKISKDGYITQQITLTSGPYEWVSVNGRHHGNYFLLKSDHFDIRLDPVALDNSRPVETIGKDGPLRAYSREAAAANNTLDSSGTGSVLIESDPPGADIYVDGKFAGQTPSTIRLSKGSHRIEVKSQGKQPWERNLEVWKDSQLTLHPVLEQQR